LHREEFDKKSEALKREKHLKSGVGRDFIKTIKDKLPGYPPLAGACPP